MNTMGRVVRRGVDGLLAGAMVVATLQLRADVIVPDVDNQPIGNASWLGGIGVWSNSAHWNITPTFGAEPVHFFIDGGLHMDSSVAVDRDVNLRSLTVDLADGVEVLEGRAVCLHGPLGSFIHNDGAIWLRGGRAASRCELRTDATVSGTGTLVLMRHDSSQIVGANGVETLTNLENLIQGAGQIGADTLRIVNHASIEANIFELPLTIDPNFAGMINHGLLQAAIGGRLRLVDGVFHNAGGTIRAMDNSRIELANATVIGGLLTDVGTGLFHIAAPVTLEDLTLNATLEVLGQTPLTLRGAMEHNATMHILAGESLTTPAISQVHIPAGDVVLNGRGVVSTNLCRWSSGSTAQGGRLIHGASHSIEGEGWIGSDTVAIINHGLIHANHSYPMWIDPKDSEPFVNTGTLRASGAGGMTITDAQFRNDGLVEVTGGSKITCTASSTLLNNVGGSLIGGTWRIIADTGNASLYISTAVISENYADITLSGPGSSFNAINGLLGNGGRLALRDRRSFTPTSAFFNNSGVLDLGAGCALNINNFFIQGASGRLVIEVGAPVSTTQDAVEGLIINGPATLDGTLEIRLANNPQLTQGQTYPLLQFQSLSGAFDRIIVPTGLALHATAQTMSVVVMNACPADVNHSSAVDINDLIVVIANWGACESAPQPCMGDLDGNGLIDIGDLVMVINAWGSCDSSLP